MASKELNEPYDRVVPSGRVTLVGAGPGAVDLITVRGQRALSDADVVVYDDLANVELLTFCRAGGNWGDLGARGAGRPACGPAEGRGPPGFWPGWRGGTGSRRGGDSL